MNRNDGVCDILLSSSGGEMISRVKEMLLVTPVSVLYEELKGMVNKAICRGAVLDIGGRGRIKNGDFKGFEGEIVDIINLGEVEKESGVERLRRWVICGCPDMRVVRRNRVREWVILGCKKGKEVVGIKYESELTYYVILIKMRDRKSVV